VTEFDRIYRRGLREVARWYRAALASQVREEPEEAEEAWERYGEALGQVLTLTALAGQARAYAATKKQGNEWEPEEWPDDKPDTFAGRAARVGFEAGVFWEALRAFRRRIPRSWTETRRIRRQMQRLAERIARTESRSALRDLTKRLEALRATLDGSFRVKGATVAQATRLRDLIARAIETADTPKGLKTGSLSAFIRRAQVEGIVGMTSARLETVYRTNTASAYNEATAEVMDKPAVTRWAPLLRLVEIHDSRTRGAPGGVYRGKGKSRNPGSHWQMDGYIATAADFKRQGLVPPNGFNCRGALIPVTFDEARSMGLVRKDESLDRAALARYNAARQRIIDRGLYPDPGFKR
jgi:hypothetical protein